MRLDAIGGGSNSDDAMVGMKAYYNGVEAGGRGYLRMHADALACTKTMLRAFLRSLGEGEASEVLPIRRPLGGSIGGRRRVAYWQVHPC